MAETLRALSQELSYVPGSTPGCDACLYYRFLFFQSFFQDVSRSVTV